MTTSPQGPSRESIIEAYADLISKHDGKIIGEGVFKRETGISEYYWKGGYRRSWSAFQTGAGYAPNAQTQKTPDEIILRRFALLALERSGIPPQADLKLKRRDDPTFPGELGFRRFGSKDALLVKVAAYCEGKPEFSPVLERLKEGISGSLSQRPDSFAVKGFVYLLRSGKNYKWNRSLPTPPLR